MKKVAGWFQFLAAVAAVMAVQMPAASATLMPLELRRLLVSLAEYDALQVACTGQRDVRLLDGLSAYVEGLDERFLRRARVGGSRTAEEMSAYYESQFRARMSQAEASAQSYARSGRGEDPCSGENLRDSFNEAGSLAVLIGHPVFMAAMGTESDDGEAADGSRAVSTDGAEAAAVSPGLVQDPVFEDLLLLELASDPAFYEDQARAAAYGIESGLYGAGSDACRDLATQLRTGVRPPVSEELLAIADRGEIRLAELLSRVRAEAPPPVQLIIVGDANLGEYDLAARGVPLRAPSTRKSVLGAGEMQRQYPITVSRGPQRRPNEVPALTGDSRYLRENSQLIENGPCQAIVTSYVQTLVASDPQTSADFDWDRRVPLPQPHVLRIQVAAQDGVDLLPMSPERARALREAGVRSVQTKSVVQVDKRPDAGTVLPGVLPGTVLRMRAHHPETGELLHEFSGAN